MTKLSIAAARTVAFTFILGGGVASGSSDIAGEDVELEIKKNPELALAHARRLFYDVNRTEESLGEARHYFGFAKDFMGSGPMRACEFWLLHLNRDFKRAEKHCLRSMEEDEYHALMALAYIYEHGPEGIRSPAHAYSCYLLVAQIKNGDLHDSARAGQKRVGRQLTRAERRKIDSNAGAGWSLF